MTDYVEPETLSLDNPGEGFVVTGAPKQTLPDGNPVKEIPNPNLPRVAGKAIKKSVSDLPACEPIRKTREHRHIATLSEVRKSHTEISAVQRPLVKTSTGGENRRVSPQTIAKSSIAAPVPFRRGISPEEYTKNDWEDQKLYKHGTEF